MGTTHMHHWILLAAMLSGCVLGPAAPAPLVFPFAVDTQRVEPVAPGVMHRFVYSSTGPWAIHVLDVNRDSCYSAVAVKGFPGAAGRARTSVMLAELDSAGRVVGGVNADFFTPNGTPTNAHVTHGRVVAGPSHRPVLAFDSTGAPHLVRMTAVDSAESGAATIRGWNRRLANGTGVFDASWGVRTDTASNVVEFVFEEDDDRPGMLTFVRLDTVTAGVEIPRNGLVSIVTQRDFVVIDPRARGDFIRERPRPALRLSPFHPLEAVGGRPILALDSSIVGDVDTEGAAGFAAARHPRTAAGIARNGRRLLLVTVDGRQRPYSDGMTLRELATLMLALGARDAINLDGGGSTTMVLKLPGSQSLTVVNAPSDASGERAVGNALGIVRGCAPTP